MGDRTYVSLYVPAELEEKTREILEDNAWITDDGESGDLAFFGLNEVNYGDIGCEAELREAGIPYDKRWEAGGGYTAGTEYLRFTASGEPWFISVADEDVGIAPDALKGALAKDDPLFEVHDLLQKPLDATEPMPWDNQVEYGRLYVAKQEVSA